MDFEFSNGVLIYYLPAELDHYQADLLKRKSESCFEENEVRYIVFDFEKVKFMDSSGIGLITGRYRRISGKKGLIYVINVSEPIDKLLFLSGIYRIAIKRDSKEEIVNDLLEGDYYEG